MRLDFGRRAKGYVNPAAVRFPPRNAGGKSLVCVGDTPVMFFLELVLRCARVWISPHPELLDEVFLLFVRLQVFEDFLLFFADDIRDVLLEPLLVVHRPAALFAFPLLLFLGRRSVANAAGEDY